LDLYQELEKKKMKSASAAREPGRANAIDIASLSQRNFAHALARNLEVFR
jgi:hypothetical protein